jgi:hypothetical protein
MREAIEENAMNRSPLPLFTDYLKDLPEVLKSVRARPLFVMRLDVHPLQIVGATPGAYRRIGVVPDGSFEGERLSGRVTPGSPIK